MQLSQPGKNMDQYRQKADVEDNVGTSLDRMQCRECWDQRAFKGTKRANAKRCTLEIILHKHRHLVTQSDKRSLYELRRISLMRNKIHSEIGYNQRNISNNNPFFKEKGSVRFSALYLKKKRNLLVFTSVDMIVMTSMVELESLFGHLFDELSNGENQVVSKSSAVTTADASDKCQQQQDSTSSTSTLATTITADGNFDL
ncbi:hypothetical protein Tco_0686386 [Tanacetum coccineum]